MSTRAAIMFMDGDDETPMAIVYRHADGYPDTTSGVPAELDLFFDECEKLVGTLSGPRLDDPNYLAAKWLVWSVLRDHASNEQHVGECLKGDEADVAHGQRMARLWGLTPEGKVEKPLAFTGLGIIQQVPSDVAYIYRVICGRGRPQVLAYAARDGKPVKAVRLPRKADGYEYKQNRKAGGL